MYAWEHGNREQDDHVDAYDRSMIDVTDCERQFSDTSLHEIHLSDRSLTERQLQLEQQASEILDERPVIVCGNLLAVGVQCAGTELVAAEDGRVWCTMCRLPRFASMPISDVDRKTDRLVKLQDLLDRVHAVDIVKQRLSNHNRIRARVEDLTTSLASRRDTSSTCECGEPRSRGEKACANCGTVQQVMFEETESTKSTIFGTNLMLQASIARQTSAGYPDELAKLAREKKKALAQLPVIKPERKKKKKKTEPVALINHSPTTIEPCSSPVSDEVEDIPIVPKKQLARQITDKTVPSSKASKKKSKSVSDKKPKKKQVPMKKMSSKVTKEEPMFKTRQVLANLASLPVERPTSPSPPRSIEEKLGLITKTKHDKSSRSDARSNSSDNDDVSITVRKTLRKDESLANPHESSDEDKTHAISTSCEPTQYKSSNIKEKSFMTHSPTSSPAHVSSSTRSPASSPVRTHSPTLSLVHASSSTHSPASSPVHAHSPTSSPVRTHSPTSSPVRTHSPTPSPAHARSPTSSSAHASSPTRSPASSPVRTSYSTHSPTSSPARDCAEPLSSQEHHPMSWNKDENCKREARKKKDNEPKKQKKKLGKNEDRNNKMNQDKETRKEIGDKEMKSKQETNDKETKRIEKTSNKTKQEKIQASEKKETQGKEKTIDKETKRKQENIQASEKKETQRKEETSDEETKEETIKKETQRKEETSDEETKEETIQTNERNEMKRNEQTSKKKENKRKHETIKEPSDKTSETENKRKHEMIKEPSDKTSEKKRKHKAIETSGIPGKEKAKKKRKATSSDSDEATAKRRVIMSSAMEVKDIEVAEAREVPVEGLNAKVWDEYLQQRQILPPLVAPMVVAVIVPKKKKPAPIKEAHSTDQEQYVEARTNVLTKIDHWPATLIEEIKMTLDYLWSMYTQPVGTRRRKKDVEMQVNVMCYLSMLRCAVPLMPDEFVCLTSEGMCRTATDVEVAGAKAGMPMFLYMPILTEERISEKNKKLKHFYDAHNEVRDIFLASNNAAVQSLATSLCIQSTSKTLANRFVARVLVNLVDADKVAKVWRVAHILVDKTQDVFYKLSMVDRKRPLQTKNKQNIKFLFRAFSLSVHSCIQQALHIADMDVKERSKILSNIFWQTPKSTIDHIERDVRHALKAAPAFDTWCVQQIRALLPKTE